MSKKKMILKKLKEMTETEAFRITPVPDKKPGLTNSKIGGMPYWDKTMEYPVSPDGEKLILLAQINLAELPANDSQITTAPGDIVLYSGNQIVVFYGSNSWAYTGLGHITDKSVDELTELLGNGDVTISLRTEYSE